MKLLTYVKIGELSENIFITIGVFNYESIDNAIEQVFKKYGAANSKEELSESVRLIAGTKYTLRGNIIVHEVL